MQLWPQPSGVSDQPQVDSRRKESHPPPQNAPPPHPSPGTEQMAGTRSFVTDQARVPPPWHY